MALAAACVVLYSAGLKINRDFVKVDRQIQQRLFVRLKRISVASRRARSLPVMFCVVHGRSTKLRDHCVVLTVFLVSGMAVIILR